MAQKNIIDAMWDDAPIDVSSEVNFIWSIANKLRGPYQSDKYKDVIIPMVIIRRFECALAPTKKAVVAQAQQNPAFPAKAMYRVSGFQFYNTSEFDLAELVNDADHCDDIQLPTQPARPDGFPFRIVKRSVAKIGDLACLLTSSLLAVAADFPQQLGVFGPWPAFYRLLFRRRRSIFNGG